MTVMFKISACEGIAYLAPKGFEHITEKEVNDNCTQRYGDLFVLSKQPDTDIYWHQNIWKELYLIEFDSINDCAKALTSMQRNWWPYLWNFFRRGQLIQKALPYVSGEPIIFGKPLPKSLLGSWTLLDERQALASPVCSSLCPNGMWVFVEDKVGPPSRAYLKLWETFSRFGKAPAKGDICLDLGASPGGWTWALLKQGGKVIAYDRSPLRDDLMRSKHVEFVKGDAFSVRQEHLKLANWLFCDVICYPQKLYDFIISKVLPAQIPNAVCTIKFQGENHRDEIIKMFSSIPSSKLVHLTANKHELTWVYGF